MKGGILCIFQVNREIYLIFLSFLKNIIGFSMYKRCWK